MLSGGWRIGRVAGIPIALHPLWIVVVALLSWSLGASWFPDRVDGISSSGAYLLGLASALLLFAGILAHELGHAIVARRRGIEVEEIDLWLLGGVARLRGEPRAPGDELRFAAAGPAVTLALALAFGGAWLAVRGGRTWYEALIAYQAEVSALILAFNLLPAFPLDGGRILHAALWQRSGDRVRATAGAAAAGRVFAAALGALGILTVAAGGPGGLWLVAIAVFLWVAGRAEEQGSRVQRTLAGRCAGEMAAPHPACIPADVTAQEAIRTHFARHLYSAFPVVDDAGRAVGLLRLDALRAVPAPERARRRAVELADTDPGLLVAASEPVADVLSGPAFQRAGRAVVVDASGRPVGLLSITDLQRTLRVADLLEPPRAA